MIAKPTRNRIFKLGKPIKTEGPCKNMEPARTKNDTKIITLRGHLAAAEFTNMQAIKHVARGNARIGPFQISSIFFSFLSTSVKKED